MLSWAGTRDDLYVRDASRGITTMKDRSDWGMEWRTAMVKWKMRKTSGNVE